MLIQKCVKEFNKILKIVRLSKYFLKSFIHAFYFMQII